MDLLKCHGREFTAEIYGVSVEGRITVQNGCVYLCQNKKDGSTCSEKHGYLFSWDAGGRNLEEIRGGAVECFQLVSPNPSEYKDWQVGDKVVNMYYNYEVIFRSGELVVIKSLGTGDAGANYTCDEMFNKGFRLVAEETIEENLVELTLEEVAKLRGVDVDRIRIKE